MGQKNVTGETLTRNMILRNLVSRVREEALGRIAIEKILRKGQRGENWE